MSFTKLNIITSLSEHLNVVSNSDTKNKKRIEEKEKLYEIYSYEYLFTLKFWEDYLCVLLDQEAMNCINNLWWEVSAVHDM